MDSGDSTVVEHSTQTPKIEGSKPAAATEGQNAALFIIKQISLC